jgi:SAM-dependent methyltransferase
LRRLSDRFETYGYDVSEYARTRCRAIASEAVVLGDWTTLEPASLDVVVALHTLEHIEQPLPVMRDLSARLRTGGLFFFVVPNPDGLGRRLKQAAWFGYRDATHRSLLSRDDWKALCRESGLEVAWVRGDGMWDAPYVREARWFPVPLQRILFGAPAALQLVSPLRRPFLPAFLGECLIVAAVKRR